MWTQSDHERPSWLYASLLSLNPTSLLSLLSFRSSDFLTFPLSTSYRVQAFVRLSFESLEIYFVATANKKTNQYTFDLDLTTAADDFGRLSGTYSIVSMSA